MEIYVEGKAEKSFTPNEVRLLFSFNKKETTYKDVLERGSKEVEEFIDFLEKLGFERKDCKTKSFSIRESNVYDDSKRNYEKDGFIFSQEMTLVFAYDVKKFADVFEKISMVENAPSCRITFGLKDSSNEEATLYEACLKDAKAQAEIIAKASGCNLIRCEKVSCTPFVGTFESSTNFGNANMAKACFLGASEAIQKTFVPEDIRIESSLYVLWCAE